MKKTQATKQVIEAIEYTFACGARVYGYPLQKRAGVRSGTLYPILAQLERKGWLTSTWETMPETIAKGADRPRRYYLKGPRWGDWSD